MNKVIQMKQPEFEYLVNVIYGTGDNTQHHEFTIAAQNIQHAAEIAGAEVMADAGWIVSIEQWN
jgi:hypothetical protein